MPDRSDTDNSPISNGNDTAAPPSPATSDDTPVKRPDRAESGHIINAINTMTAHAIALHITPPLNVHDGNQTVSTFVPVFRIIDDIHSSPSA